jgi:hypothetical protein
MKKKLFIVLVILLVCLPAFNIKIAWCTSRPAVNWAILVAGTNAAINPFGLPSARTEEALHNCYYMFHVLRNDFGVARNHIRFLHIAPGSVKGKEVPYDDIDGECTSGDDVESAINWVKSQCGSSDNVLIFIASHGGGYWADMGVMTRGGRIDYDGDEDGDGVDESIVFFDFANPSYIYEAY